jgi:hypothetical protein
VEPEQEGFINPEPENVRAAPPPEAPKAAGSRSSRHQQVPNKLYPEKDYVLTARTKPGMPQSYREALSDPLHHADWQQAIDVELTKLQALDTWEFIDLPPGKRTMGCKWVFDLKYTPTGLIDHYKARLVAQGFTQVPGDDFLETFLPTIRLELLRVLLAIAVYRDLEVRQLDVINAYTCSDLHATVYMRPPEGLKCPEGKVLHVKKSLYGLKQSGWEWYIAASRGLEHPQICSELENG